MNNNYGNIEKIILGVFVLIFVFCLVWGNNSVIRYRKLINDKTGALNPQRINNNVSEVNNKDIVLDEKNHSKSAGGGNPEKIRDIFVKLIKEIESKPEVFLGAPAIEVMQISYKPLEIEYKGRLVFDDGKLVAQVNLQDRSYLVSLGSEIFQYRVDYLDENYINLKNKNKKNTRIQYRHAAYSNELVAQIKEHNSQRMFTVSKDSNFLGYKVLDIDEEYVLLSKKGQHLRLEKGMVHK